jgi:phosphohistidine phosphatase SixA
MIVTIWRHGEAGSAPSDRQRELTDRGTDDVAFGCHCFHDTCIERHLPPPARILHSSWLRTTQTADILASAFTHAERGPCEALIPGSDVAHVDRALTDIVTGDACPEHLVLVSHQPLVTHLVDHLVGERGRVPSLTPGGLVALRLEVPAAGCAELLFWALPPDYEAHV